MRVNRFQRWSLLLLLAAMAPLHGQQTYSRLTIIPQGDGSAGVLGLRETGGGADIWGLKVPGSLSGNKIFTVPSGDGTAGQALCTDGAFALGWCAISGGGGSASGDAGTVQFSGGSGAFAGDASNLFWNNTDKRLGLGSGAPSHRLHVVAGANGSGIADGLRLQSGANIGDGAAIILGNSAFPSALRLAGHTSSGSTIDLVFTAFGGLQTKFLSAGDWTFPGNVTLTDKDLVVSSGDVEIHAGETADQTLFVQGIASQTADLFTVANSGAGAYLRVTGEANVTANEGAGVLLTGHHRPTANRSFDSGSAARMWREFYAHESFHEQIWAVSTTGQTPDGQALMITDYAGTNGIRAGVISATGNAILQAFAPDGAAKVTLTTVNTTDDYGQVTVVGEIGVFHAGGTQGHINAQGDVRAGADGTGVFRGPSGAAGFSGNCGASTTLTVSGGVITGCS